MPFAWERRSSRKRPWWFRIAPIHRLSGIRRDSPGPARDQAGESSWSGKPWARSSCQRMPAQHRQITTLRSIALPHGSVTPHHLFWNGSAKKLARKSPRTLGRSRRFLVASFPPWKMRRDPWRQEDEGSTSKLLSGIAVRVWGSISSAYGESGHGHLPEPQTLTRREAHEALALFDPWVIPIPSLRAAWKWIQS
jgi:hypothetical protein